MSDISRAIVNREFAYARALMRHAHKMMKGAAVGSGNVWNQAEAQSVADDLVAAVTTFVAYVEAKGEQA